MRSQTIVIEVCVLYVDDGFLQEVNFQLLIYGGYQNFLFWKYLIFQGLLTF